MTHKEFLSIVQSRVARVSVGASAVRGQPKKTVEAARVFLRSQVDLRAFGTANEQTFSAELNRTTEALQRALPRSARHWGVARKLLNIFLLNCFYTTYLNKAFHLDLAEELLELPLDSITGTHLNRVDDSLPKWPGVKHLNPIVSARFQEAAADRVTSAGVVARVHLDALWWSAARDQ